MQTASEEKGCSRLAPISGAYAAEKPHGTRTAGERAVRVVLTAKLSRCCPICDASLAVVRIVQNGYRQ